MFSILGANIISPIIMAVIPKTKTAPAAVSLAIFARGCTSFVIKSIAASMLVLISSVAITSPIISMIISHSMADILKMKPAIMTHIVARK